MSETRDERLAREEQEHYYDHGYFKETKQPSPTSDSDEELSSGLSWSAIVLVSVILGIALAIVLVR
jgi:hypothetical protein